MGTSSWPAALHNLFNPRRHLAELFGPSGSGRTAALDGVRTFSVLVVFLSHIPTIAVMFGPLGGHWPAQPHPAVLAATPGILGVDAFFVLSGFLIATMLLKESSTRGTVDVGAFYRRRALRILPLYFCMLALTLHAWPQPENVLANLVMLNNFLPTGQSVLPWSWSLAVEEQFYLVFPWVFLLLLKLRPSWRLPLMVTALLGLGALALALAVENIPPVRALEFIAPPSGYYGETFYPRPHTRAGAIVLGVCVGFWLAAHPKGNGLLRDALGLFGLAGVAAIHFHPVLSGAEASSSALLTSALYALRHLGYAACIGAIIIGVHSPGRLGRALATTLSLRGFTVFSRLTYSFYLVHPIVVHATFRLLAPPGLEPLDLLPVGVLSLAASLPVAGLLYVLVEAPFMHLRPVVTSGSSQAVSAQPCLLQAPAP